MHYARKILGSVLLVGGLSGCGSITDAYMVDSLTTGKNYRDVNDGPLSHHGVQMVPAPFDLTRDCMPLGHADGTGSCPSEEQDGSYRKTAYQIATENKDGRNRVMGFLIQRSNQICEVHKAAIVSNASSTNFLFGEATTILSGLGSVISPESAAKALSGAAAITNGTRAQINEVVYQNMLSTAVVKGIDGARKAAYDAIVSKRDKTLTEYSADEMIAEVMDYHAKCSFYEGILTLTEASSHITPSSLELKARIDALRAEIKQNETDAAAAALPANAQKLLDRNVPLHAGIAQLEVQLASAQTQGK